MLSVSAIFLASFLVLEALPLRRNALKALSYALFAAGYLTLVMLFVSLWSGLERPPMKTMGETRLLYSMLLPVIGLLAFFFWKIKWMFEYTVFVSLIFMIINIFHPEYMDKTMMPALQSPWFIPHVVVYIAGYSALTGAAIASAAFLMGSDRSIEHVDRLVDFGFTFLTLGIVFGAMWAKVAWGDYWSWDPKESWALATWLTYLGYIHLRAARPGNIKAPLYLAIAAIIVLFVCWMGINYLPSSGASVHTYS